MKNTSTNRERQNKNTNTKQIFIILRQEKEKGTIVIIQKQNIKKEIKKNRRPEQK